MIHYILQTVAFQLLFMLVYDLFLKKETFFNSNRLYLIFTPLLSLILPFVQISAIRQHVSAEYIVNLPAVLIGDTGANSFASTSSWTFSFLTIENLWLLGIIVSFIFFMIKVIRVFNLKRKGTKIMLQGIQFIKLPNTNTAFTFFRTIYLGENLSEEQQQNILMHERVHVVQKHTLDLLFFEFLRIVFWFNPLIYIFQKRAAILHEFIADKAVAIQKSNSAYYQDLLAQVFQTEKISFINTFFNHSLIKKRIIMLQKSKSKKILQLKYLLLLPLVGGMLFYTSCSNEISAQENTFEEASANSEIIENIERLKESIAKKGNISKEEEDALKVLYVLTSEDGVNTRQFEQVKEKVEIPFGVIEKVPVYPGCENMSNEEAKKCFSEKITQFVIQEFDTKVAKPEVTGNQRISLQFKIDLAGNVVNVKAKSKHLELQEEAVRVVSELPKMTPGEHEGKKVGVIYSLPIIFAIK